MKTIRYTNTLFYYDGPQIFEARDAIGGHYVAVMVEPNDVQDRYLIVGVHPERLRLFRSGSLDLRSLLIQGATQEWYLASAAAGLDEPLTLLTQSGPLEESNLLPDPGFFLTPPPTKSKQIDAFEAAIREPYTISLADHEPV